MLQPKRTKFRKAHKGRIKGTAKGGTALNFGSHGLKAVEPERVTARQIEADNFRAAFPRARIIVADQDDHEAAMLLAVDQNDIVLGATRGARRAFGLSTTGPLSERPASDLFGREDGPTGFEKAERAAVIRALARADGNVSEAARTLGVGRATLYRRMKRLGIE